MTFTIQLRDVCVGLCRPLVPALALMSSPAWAQGQQAPAPPPDAQTAPAPTDENVFKLGEIVYVLGQDPGTPGVSGSVVTREQLQTFERTRLDQAVNMVPGVVSTFDANGRRNESDIFVRGFGRQQVPLMVDGVRIYLPADNRLDFGRFLTEIGRAHV